MLQPETEESTSRWNWFHRRTPLKELDWRMKPALLHCIQLRFQSVYTRYTVFLGDMEFDSEHLHSRASHLVDVGLHNRILLTAQSSGHSAQPDHDASSTTTKLHCPFVGSNGDRANSS